MHIVVKFLLIYSWEYLKRISTSYLSYLSILTHVWEWIIFIIPFGGILRLRCSLLFMRSLTPCTHIWWKVACMDMGVTYVTPFLPLFIWDASLILDIEHPILRSLSHSLFVIFFRIYAIFIILGVFSLIFPPYKSCVSSWMLMCLLVVLISMVIFSFKQFLLDSYFSFIIPFRYDWSWSSTFLTWSLVLLNL